MSYTDARILRYRAQYMSGEIELDRFDWLVGRALGLS